MLSGMDKRTLPILLLCFLLSAAAARGDILVIDGPERADSGQYVTLSISGLSTSELARASVTCEPERGVSLLPATTWGGQPILMFMATDEAQYEITITVNGFVQAFKVAFDQARNSQVDSKTLELYRSLDSVLVAEYPRSHASHKITVGQPKPEPDPPVPPDKVQLLLIEETGDRRPPYGDLYIQLRRSETLKDTELYIVDRDGRTPEGRSLPNIRSYIDQMSHPLPVLFVIGEQDGKGKILWQGTCPPSLTGVLEVVGMFRKVP
jgi:hypothetical protein